MMSHFWTKLLVPLCSSSLPVHLVAGWIRTFDFPGRWRHHLLIVYKFPQRDSLTQGGPQPRTGAAGSGSILRPRDICWIISSHSPSFLSVALCFPLLSCGEGDVGLMALAEVHLESMSLLEISLSPVFQNQVQSLETWTKHKVLILN